MGARCFKYLSFSFLPTEFLKMCPLDALEWLIQSPPSVVQPSLSKCQRLKEAIGESPIDGLKT